MTFRKMFFEKWFTGKHFTKNKEKKEIKTCKMFSPFQIRKTFYRKMAWFSVDQENVFRWPLIFRETNTRKCWKHFPVSHFQWNKRTLNEILISRNYFKETTVIHKGICRQKFAYILNLIILILNTPNVFFIIKKFKISYLEK